MRLLVTGAAAGLGLELTRELVRRGHHVYALDLKPLDLKGSGLARRAPSGGTVVGWRGDVTSERSLRLLATRLGPRPLDALVNNAAVGHYGELLKLDPAVWRRQLEVNLTGPFLVTRVFGPRIIRHRGRIVNIGSRRSYLPGAGYGGYCAAKFGLRGLSLCLAQEMASHAVPVTVLELGSMLTDLGGRLTARRALASSGQPVLLPEKVAPFVADLLEGRLPWQEEFFLEPDASGSPQPVSF